MAIATPTLVGAGLFPIERINPWAVNYYIEDGDPAVEVKAAPTGAGQSLYIEHVSFSKYTLAQDVKLTLQDEDGIKLFGPIQLEHVGDVVFQKDWKNPLKLIDNKALYVFGNIGATAFVIYVEGFTADKPLG